MNTRYHVLPPKQQVGGQAVLGRQPCSATPWLTERHGYDPTSRSSAKIQTVDIILPRKSVYK